MTPQTLSNHDLISCVKSSQMLDFLPESKVWFTHLNLHKYQGKKIPDNDIIAEQLISYYDLADIQHFLLLIDHHQIEQWTEENEPVSFQVLIEIELCNRKNELQNNLLEMRGCVWKNVIDPETILEIFKNNPNSLLDAVALNRQAVIVDSKQPLRLEVLKIPKPWGYEGWYTGVEKRGVVKVTDDFGKTELPCALTLFKKQMLAGHSESLILLKTLNPVAEEAVGDLYFELHEKKWEVYVVTEIDNTAWPSGTGIIKAGLCPEKIEKYQQNHGNEWTTKLLHDFKSAVGEYEVIRRQIDDSQDQITKEMLAQELELRENASDFVGDLPVKVGDIISFPVLQIHSLRHGIKVIEFQTPHYERLILMFAQKVLTQNHWDTEEAINKMQADVYHPPKLECIQKSTGLAVERFNEFPQFAFDRICLEPNNSFKDQLDGKYHLLIVISGQAEVSPLKGKPIVLNAEESLFMPVAMGSYRLESTGESQLICLKAAPK
jgi:hypothetical protein